LSGSGFGRRKKKTIAHASFLSSLPLSPPLSLNSPASNARTTTSAALSAASVAARSSSRLDVSTSVSGTPSGVASAGKRVGGREGGGDAAKVSVAAAVMSAVLPTRGSPATTTVTGLERWGEDILTNSLRRTREGGEREREKERWAAKLSERFRRSSSVFFFFAGHSISFLSKVFLDIPFRRRLSLPLF